MCGLWHRGQRARVACVALWVARRLSRRALEVLFFGTAMGARNGSAVGALAAVALRDAELLQLRPARIDTLPVVVRARLGTLEALAADRTEALAVFSAED